ncbi:hypothetical protein [Segatella oulorum]|uniref:hypothetical protein n=1 Tax=Segatella oulorum TaxID=28136 RepID=UPI0023F2A154|nr:hypothetical protein [Segatella oulorum]
MKTTNIIQRLCLFLFVLVLAAPAWATDYGRFDYETFRSRNTVNAVGKKKPVSTLRQGRVEINFSDCRTTSGTDNSAIYELAKGSHFSVKVDEGYAVRWIILRDTEGGKDYDEREGIWRIDRVPHYAYFFEKTAISNAHISGGNKDNLNDDNNNIVVYNYSAPERVVNIYTHNNKDWGQFKVRDIIVGYVKVPKVKFERDRYDVYTVSGGFYANLDKDEYDGKVEYNVANYEDVVKLYGDGSLKLLHPGTEVLTAIFPANEKFAGASCSTTINVKRDRVTFNYQIERPKVLYYEGEGYAHEVHNLYDYSDFTTESGIPYKSGNDGFNVECTNDNVLRPEAMSGKCFFEGTAGTVDVTINQRKNDLYEESSLKQTFTVIRTDKGAHTMLIKDLNEWKVFAHLVNDEGMTNLNARLEADINLGGDIAMIGRYDHKYAGTFDGQNHTLTLNWNTGESDIAPFRRVDGATIKNLRTEGEIKSSSHFLSGLVQSAYGNTTISGCVSAVNITSSYNEGGCDAAGMVECVRDNAKVTITDCVVKGKFHATMEKGRRYMSGFVCNQYGKCTITNCLYIGENNCSRGYTFCTNSFGGTTITNCYYLNACRVAQGTKVTAEQLKNGEVAKKLQNNRTDKCYWAQQLGEMPDFYNAADKSKANYVYYDAAKKGWTCDDFRLTDGTAMPIGLDFTAATVTYERNFNGAQKATLCLPYDLYAQGFKAYTLSGGNKNEVHFKEVDDKLTAYTPYYITANGMPQLGGRNIEVKAYKADKMTTPAAGYKFTGTVAGVSNATAAADNAYILQDDGKFHKVTTTNSAATIPAYRAYIICPPQASGAKQLSVVLDGETTGIGSTTNEATDGKNGPVYDLQGRRVADRLDDSVRRQIPTGVYIVNGRKVIVK